MSRADDLVAAVDRIGNRGEIGGASVSDLLACVDAIPDLIAVARAAQVLSDALALLPGQTTAEHRLNPPWFHLRGVLAAFEAGA